MLRMNREKNTLKTSVKKHCSNYNTGYICSGIMIDKELNQFIDPKHHNKPCTVANGKECKYYEKVVRKVAGF